MILKLLSLILIGSWAFGSTTVCTYMDKLSNQQTMFALQSGSLMAICQRSTSPTAQRLSNEEICGDDMFVTHGFLSGPIQTQTIFSSMKSGVKIILESKNDGSGTVELSSTYSATTLKGGNKVQIPKGTIKVTCKKH